MEVSRTSDTAFLRSSAARCQLAPQESAGSSPAISRAGLLLDHQNFSAIKMAEKEPTLEELMAELDAGLTLDLNETSNDNTPAEAADDGDPTDFEAELGLIAKEADETAKADKPAADAPPPARALPAEQPGTAAPEPAPEPAPAPARRPEAPIGNEGSASTMLSWWSAVKASAEGMVAADGISVDTSALSADYQRGKEASRDVASKLSSFFALASQEVMNTAADVAGDPPSAAHACACTLMIARRSDLANGSLRSFGPHHEFEDSAQTASIFRGAPGAHRTARVR